MRQSSPGKRLDRNQMRSEFCHTCFVDLAPGEKCSRCGDARSPAAGTGDVLLPGSVLGGKLKVGRLLGRGGFGATYLAWDINLRVRIAIKEFLPRQLAARESGATRIHPFPGSEDAFNVGLQQFLSEARNLARFRDHPGIISVLDFFPENGTGYMVMEYLDGSTLEQYIASVGGLDVSVALRLLVPVADALRACHAVGLIHRDISPDNIFLTMDGRVKVLDFGASRFAIGSQSANLSVILKEGYAPFEQYQKNGRQGPWTDIYALTATLYRLLTGELPVAAPDRVAGTPLPPPSEKGVEISRRLQALLDKGMAIQPEQRYRTIDGFLDDLQAALRTSGPSLDSTRPPQSPRPVPHDHRVKGEMRPVLGHIGKYELRSVLAHTATSIVYDGWDADIARRVAIKAMPLSTLEENDSRNALARFKHGVQAARQLDHPNVINVYDYVETDEYACIVMEFVDGPTLKQMLDTGQRLDIPAICKVMDGILQGLQYSHDRGVVHCYIKPANIMFTKDQRVKITDFGIVRFEDSNMTQPGMMVGSLAYMSPEQFKGEKIDGRSDIYSAGVVLYHMITGFRPYAGSLATITDKVLNSPVPRPSGRSPTVKPALDQIVTRAMAKKREHRFQSAAEFNVALQAALTPAELAHVPVTPPRVERLLPFWLHGTFRARPVVAAGVIIFLAATGFGTARYWLSAPGPLQPGMAVSDSKGADTHPVEAPPPAPDKGAENATAALQLPSDRVSGTPDRQSKSAATVPAEPTGAPTEGATPMFPEQHDADRSGTGYVASVPAPPPPPELTSPASREPAVYQNPPPPSQPPDVSPLKKPSGSAIRPTPPPPIPSNPGGPKPRQGSSFDNTADGRAKIEAPVRSPSDIPLVQETLNETLNRLRNGIGSSVSPSRRDSPAAPAPENTLRPPPAYPTISTSAVGLVCQTVTSDTARQLGLDAPRGLWCTGVAAGSDAAKAGIHSNDVLLTINGSEARDLSGLQTIAGDTSPGHTVPVSIFRDGSVRTVHLAVDQLRH
jgi:serine/threonine protein kinase